MSCRAAGRLVRHAPRPRRSSLHTMKKIAVLGGGVSGVIAAKHLADKKTANVHVIEKSRQLGGLHRGIRLDGLVFDIGGCRSFSGPGLCGPLAAVRQPPPPPRAT